MPERLIIIENPNRVTISEVIKNKTKKKIVSLKLKHSKHSILLFTIGLNKNITK
jgi:hypothetical protein